MCSAIVHTMDGVNQAKTSQNSEFCLPGRLDVFWSKTDQFKAPFEVSGVAFETAGQCASAHEVWARRGISRNLHFLVDLDLCVQIRRSDLCAFL